MPARPAAESVYPQVTVVAHGAHYCEGRALGRRALPSISDIVTTCQLMALYRRRNDFR
jgi:hypothetical protein